MEYRRLTGRYSKSRGTAFDTGPFLYTLEIYAVVFKTPEQIAFFPFHETFLLSFSE